MVSYDSLAEAWEADTAASAYNAHYERPAMLELVGDVEGKCVLDAACGAGFSHRRATRSGR